jgi:hypothetical protein
LEAIGLAGQPLDAIAIDGFFKNPAVGAKPGLQTNPGRAPTANFLLIRSERRIKYPKGKERKTFTFTEQPIDQFAAFKPFLFAEREFLVADGIFLIPPKDQGVISNSIRRKRSAYDGLSCGGWPTLCDHWPFACVYEIRERSCGGAYVVGMYVS